MNIRKEILDEALHCVNNSRAAQYSPPENSFNNIADLWNAYLKNKPLSLGPQISNTDVAVMLALMKIARLKTNPTHKDSWVDIAGYAACGAECALPKLKTKKDPNADNLPRPILTASFKPSYPYMDNSHTKQVGVTGLKNPYLGPGSIYGASGGTLIPE